MKKLILASVTAAMFGLSQHASASFIIGSFESGNCYPFMCNDSGTSVGESIEYQQVYSSTAFPGPVSISSLTFYYDSPDGGNEAVLNGNYDISLSTTTAPVNGLSADLATNVGPDSATFFNGALGGPYVSQFTISGTPFSYNPSNGNLLLDVLVTNQDDVPNGSGNGYNQADDSGSVVSRAYFVTNGSNGADAEGLVTGFNLSIPEPASIVLLGAGLLGLGLLRRRPV